MAGVRAPIRYKVESKEEIIIAYALREYFSAISIFSEIMSHYKKTGRYPGEPIDVYVGHVIHLAEQMTPHNKKFPAETIKIAFETDKLESFKLAHKLFRKVQNMMNQKGFISLRSKAVLEPGEKGRDIALGVG